MKNNTRLLLLAFLLVSFVRTSNADNRSIDGIGNNLSHPTWGAAGTQLGRIADADYSDGISSLAGAGRPSPRQISNLVAAQPGPIPNDRQLCSFVWQWGQFVDHDIDLTHDGGAYANIPVPTGDVFFDPTATGTATIPMTRSEYDLSTGTSVANPRQQINAITSYIDASNVYGSDAVRAGTLRSFTGGKMLMRGEDLLPKNTFGLPNANPRSLPATDLVLAGDIRANEQISLTAMHTLFVREHNRLADGIAANNPVWTDEQIYQRARKIVGAEMQVITYQEFLPALLGPYAPGVESTYDDSVDASIVSEFSTSLYRLGHSMIGSDLLRLQNDGGIAPGGHLALRDAFFDPALLSSSDELDYLLKGMSTQQMQEIDTMEVDELRNFMFGNPGAGGLDLASLNVQRGRDHGVPDYNSVRVAYGLDVNSFEEITGDVDLQNALSTLYGGDVNDIDLWVGALAEDHLSGASVGELLATGISDQFARLRDGDRFWYGSDPEFSASDIAALESTKLSDVILRNTGVTGIQADLMFVPEPATPVPFVFAVLLWGCATRGFVRNRATRSMR
ncbi:peroxidase family protein [Planctomycetota bacterium]